MAQKIGGRSIIFCLSDIDSIEKHSRYSPRVRVDDAQSCSLIEVSDLLRGLDEKVTLMVSAPNLADLEFDRIKRISAEFPEVNIVLLTERVSRDSFAKAIEAGIQGVLPSFVSTKTLYCILELLGLGEKIFLGAEVFD
jgi:DNA-binding NarL/FixJ family response regulator